MSVNMISLEEFSAFQARVIKVAERIAQLGYGTQAQIAYDCRLNATRISNVLRCRMVDIDALEKIEQWVRLQPAIEEAASDLVVAVS